MKNSPTCFIGLSGKMRLTATIISMIIMVNPGFAQSIPKDSLFLGQVPPGNKPEKFPLSVT